MYNHIKIILPQKIWAKYSNKLQTYSNKWFFKGRRYSNMFLEQKPPDLKYSNILISKPQDIWICFSKTRKTERKHKEKELEGTKHLNMKANQAMNNRINEKSEYMTT